MHANTLRDLSIPHSMRLGMIGGVSDNLHKYFYLKLNNILQGLRLRRSQFDDYLVTQT